MENQEGPQNEAISPLRIKAGEANLCIAANPQENSLMPEDDDRLARDGSFEFPVLKVDEVEPLPQGWLQKSSTLALSENCEPSLLNGIINESKSNISTTKEETLTSQKSYQELQWSSLDDAFARSKKEGKLGSFSDFLSELEKPSLETEAVVIGKHNGQPFEQIEPISVYDQTWANQPNPNLGLYVDYSADGWNQICDPLKDQGKNFSMESLNIQNNGQVLNSNQESIEDRHNLSDLSRFEEQTNWEQLYPGWYFDYQAQEWRQAEGNQLTSLQKEEAHLQKEDSSTLQGQQSASTLTESNIDQQYLGWYYNYKTQTWQQMPHQGSLNELKSSLPRASEHSTYDETLSFNNQSLSALYNNTSYTTSEYLSQESAFDQKQHLVSSGIETILGWSNNYPKSAQSPPCELRSAVIVAPRTSVEALRSSAGQPSHTLFTFGFGGKVALMNLIDFSTVHTASSGGSGFVGSPTGSPTVVSIQNLGHLVEENAESRYQNGVSQYFKVLDRQGVSGPVVGNAGIKDILKWVDERMANCHLDDPNCTNPETLRMLWGVLKIACQHYGKLRSVGASSGIDSMVEDGPEVALGKLLVSNKIQKDFMISKAPSQHLNSDQQLQAIANEMKNLLVTGKRKQALECAKQGSLWGPALVLALQLGEKYYAETVTLMVHQQFASGCPLGTLCLLLSGQTTEVFAIDPSPFSGLSSHPYGGVSSTLNQDKPDLTASVKNSAPEKCDNSETGGNSYFNHFGFLAKAVGFIRHSRKEAKLGEKNKFYYDEKLKRWVEEGVEPTPEEVSPPPPPVTTKFLSKDGASNFDSLSYLKNELKESVGSSEVMNFTSGTPPLPLSVNQFSARSRIHGVRSRYVDTFNKSGSSQTTLVKPFQSPGIPSSDFAVTLKSPASFFIPPALPNPEASFNDGESQSSGVKESQSPKVEESQRKSKRHSSVDNVACLLKPENLAISAQHVDGDMALNRNAGRAASWNGFLSDSEAMALASANTTSNTHHPSQLPLSLPPIGSIFLPTDGNDSLQGKLFKDMQEVEL